MGTMHIEGVVYEQGEPVLIEINTTLNELMLKLQCAPILIHDAQMNGLMAEYKETGVRIYVAPTAKGVIEQLAPIKLGVLSSIISGNLPSGGATFSLARNGIEKAVKKVLSELAILSVYHEIGEEPVYVPLSSAETAKILGASETTSPSLSAIFQPPPKGKAPSPSSALPALKDANGLLQPVKGTDEGSTYFVIALSDDVKVAARIKHKGSFSMRVEGPGVKAIKGILKQVGFTDNGTYCSVHMAADSDLLVHKSIGAMLFGMGLKFDQSVTHIHPIWGQGA